MSSAITKATARKAAAGSAGGGWRSAPPRTGLVVLMAAGSGLVTAAFLPRGPATVTQVAALMTGALLIGILAGLALGPGRALLAGPLPHLAAFELARYTVFEVPGPTLDRPRFDVTMGIFVFLTSHVMYAVVALAPMILGAAIGAAVLRHRQRRQLTNRLGMGFRWGFTVLLAVLVGALGVQLLRAGRVAPVLGQDGKPVPGSIATMRTITLGGVDQVISIRGRSVANPVLLHLSGGPGSSDVGWVRTFNQALEDHFTVVVWEQRGVGKSYPALDPVRTFTLDRLVNDGIGLTRWLAGRFAQPKIYLTGNSWGSTLGVLMVQRHPELYYAYAGTGQMVSQRETDKLLYQQLLAYAERTGEAGLRAELRELGPPPYRDVLAYATVMEYYDAIEPYQHTTTFDRARGLSGFFPDEYSLLDTWNELRGFADMGGLLYPQLQQLDFRATVPRLEVPVYFMQGRHELSARSRFADEWISRLQAPIKRVYVFEHSGHNPDAEESARFNELMINTVLVETIRR